MLTKTAELTKLIFTDGIILSEYILHLISSDGISQDKSVRVNLTDLGYTEGAFPASLAELQEKVNIKEGITE